MPRLAKRAHVDHQAVADGLREMPGVELPIGPYRSAFCAQTVASDITAAYRMPVYAPPGAYQARAAYDADQEPIVLVRYVGRFEPDPTPALTSCTCGPRAVLPCGHCSHCDRCLDCGQCAGDPNCHRNCGEA